MIGALNHVTLSVRDLERAFSFYRETLGFRPLARWKAGAYLLAGETTWLCLILEDSPREAPFGGYTHLAFSVAGDEFDAAVNRLTQHGVPKWQENSSEGASFYFLDPDQHRLELHVGDWRSRLADCRRTPYEDMRFFE